MSKFVSRRTTSASADGYNDHGLLTGLSDDDHSQYLITSSIRTLESPASGLSKTGSGTGNVFSLLNSGSGSALYIQQSNNTTVAAVDIDNSSNSGKALNISSSNSSPNLPLIQFNASNSAFNQPILSVEHANPCGLALQVLGDAYVGCQLEVAKGMTLGNLIENPFELGQPGIYIKNNEFYFVDEFGIERTWTSSVSPSNIMAGCNINVNETEDGYSEVSLDIQSVAGEGLIVSVSNACPQLQVDLDAYQVDYSDSNNLVIFAENLQDAIDEIDGYLQGIGATGQIVHVRKFGSDATNAPFNTVFDLDGNEYPVGKDRLLVFINGISQFIPQNFTERDTTTIEFAENIDHDAVIDILILPGSLGGGNGGTTNLQGAYNNSISNAKDIVLNDGQITMTQTVSTGSVLRLRTNSVNNPTPTLDINHEGIAEAARFKSIYESKPTLLIQKDASSRNSTLDTIIIERTTSHVSGALSGIGSTILTKLENTGGNLFNAGKIITATEDAGDSIEKTYLSFELADDGILNEHMRLTSTGNVGIGTSIPDASLHVQGDGYVSDELSIANKVRAGTNTTLPPLNMPIFNTNPTTIEDGDFWIVNDGITREIKVQINGTIYTTTLT